MGGRSRCIIHATKIISAIRATTRPIDTPILLLLSWLAVVASTAVAMTKIRNEMGDWLSRLAGLTSQLD
jgi:hypothetical protein